MSYSVEMLCLDILHQFVAMAVLQICQFMKKDINTLSFKLKEVMEEFRTFKDKVCIKLFALYSYFCLYTETFFVKFVSR